MKIQVTFSGNEVRTQEHGSAVARWIGIIANAMLEPLGGAEKFIESFVVADAPAFAEAVYEADPNEGFTDDVNFVAGGKTIKIPGAIRPVTRVIVRIEFVEEVMMCGAELPTSGMGLTAFFLIAHEVGHAIDNETRSRVAEVPALTDTNWLRGWRIANSEMVVQEIAAQRFAAMFSTPLFFAEQEVVFYENAAVIADEINAAKVAFRDNDISKNRLANVASLSGWRIIEQFAKTRILQLRLPDTTPGETIGFLH